MTLNNDLFILIKSMDKNERRYFKLNSELQKGNKTYIELFTQLSKESTYNEKLFKEKHKGKRFIKNFAYNKNHLYTLLIRSLTNYSHTSTADGKIHAMIAECWILFNKAMYQRYFRALARAKKFAYRHEKFGYLLQILDMERIIIPKRLLQKIKADEILTEAKDAAGKMMRIFEYGRTASMLLNNFRYFGLSRDESQTEELERITAAGIMSDIKNADSTRAMEAYYRVQEISSGMKADNEIKHSALKKRYEIVTSNPHPFKDYILNYPINILYALTECCLALNRTNEAESYLDKLYSEVKNEKFSLEDFEIFREYLYLRIHLNKGEIDKAVKLIPRLEGILMKYKDKLQIDTELSILYHITICRIEEKNFSKALIAANNLLSHPLLSKRSDYESYIQVLNLVIHFELKNYELLRHLLVRTYRYLCKHEKLFKTEQLIIEFIRKLQKVKTDDDLNFNFRTLSKKLNRLRNDKYEKNAFEYFDLLKWVNSRLV